MHLIDDARSKNKAGNVGMILVTRLKCMVHAIMNDTQSPAHYVVDRGIHQ